ncbi:MAG: hypothetical protein ACTSWD_15910 [Candidatus Heimdallarchaeota archaeon]
MDRIDKITIESAERSTETTFLPEDERKKFSSLKTRLEPVNKVHSIEEGIQAKVKDPLWLLGRQWQMGEFDAQNCGRPIKTEVSYSQKPLNKVCKDRQNIGNEISIDDLQEPLEKIVEEEPIQGKKDDFRVPSWDPKRLEYIFKIKDETTVLEAEEYDGNNLDWYTFNMINSGEFLEKKIYLTVPPTRLTYFGMPNSRWWAFEDKSIDVGEISRTQLNYLTMLLIEFSLLYSNDWFILPIKYDVGTIRKISRFAVIDSFGVITNLDPVTDVSDEKKGWEVFTFTPKNEEEKADGRIFYSPNNLFSGGLESEPLEEVSFMRDELANLVWGIEHRYQEWVNETVEGKKIGKIINRHDEEDDEKFLLDKTPVHYWDKTKNIPEEILIRRNEMSAEDVNQIGEKFIGPLDKYEMMSYVPQYWIPYVTRRITALEGQIVLRRGKTRNLENINNEGGDEVPKEGRQYKGVLLNESKYIFEEEIPKTGISVKRLWQLARDSLGKRYLWRNRKKQVDFRRKSSSLKFDFLENLSKKGGI